MDRRIAMRRAHAEVAAMIDGVLGNFESPDEDEPDDWKIIEALRTIADRHRTAANPRSRP